MNIIYYTDQLGAIFLDLIGDQEYLVDNENKIWQTVNCGEVLIRTIGTLSDTKLIKRTYE